MSHKKKQLVALYFLTALVIAILYNLNPAENNNIYPPSLSREWGGFYCPGCGTLRALHQLLHGNWRAALRFNPLLVICLPYFFYWIIPYFFQYFYEIKLYSINHKNKQILGIITVCLAYGLLRNISDPNFSWLVPPS